MQAIARGLGVTMGELKVMSDKGKRLIGLFSRSVIRPDLIYFWRQMFYYINNGKNNAEDDLSYHVSLFLA